MPQTKPQREKLPPPLLPIRLLRDAHGLTLPALAERIRDHGQDVTADHLSNCELGWKRPSTALLHAWCKALAVPKLDAVVLTAEDQAFLGLDPEEKAALLASATRTAAA